MARLCPETDRSSACFLGGSVSVDGEPTYRLGQVQLTQALSIELKNHPSFGRISLQASSQWRFACTVDYVPAPAAWKLDAADAAQFAHLNFKINKIALGSHAHGVVGQTSRVKLDENGLPVLTAQDKDGKGLIDGVPSDYELDTLLSTDFKFSAFDDEQQQLDAMGFVESKLNLKASELFNL